MSKSAKPAPKVEAKTVLGSYRRARRHAKHLKRHPNDQQSANGFKADRVKNKPKNKLGWTHDSFKNVPPDFKALIHGKEDSFAYAKILKAVRKVANLLNHKERPKEKKK